MISLHSIKEEWLRNFESLLGTVLILRMSTPYKRRERVLCTYMMFSAPFNEIQLKKMNS